LRLLKKESGQIIRLFRFFSLFKKGPHNQDLFTMPVHYIMPKHCEPLRVVVRLKKVGESVEAGEHIVMLKTEDGHLLTAGAPTKAIVSELPEQLSTLDKGDLVFSLDVLNEKNGRRVLNMLTSEAIRRHIEQKQPDDEPSTPRALSKEEIRSIRSMRRNGMTFGRKQSAAGLVGVLSLLSILAFFMTGASENGTGGEQGGGAITQDGNGALFQSTLKEDLYQAERSYVVAQDRNFYDYYLQTIDVDYEITPYFIRRNDSQESIRPLETGEFLIANRFTYKHPETCQAYGSSFAYPMLIRDPITRQLIGQKWQRCPTGNTQLVSSGMSQRQSNEQIQISAVVASINVNGAWTEISPARVHSTPVGSGNCAAQGQDVRFSYTQTAYDLNLRQLDQRVDNAVLTRYVSPEGC
jgi:hypothetical protein